jgi:hypothetical protein
MPALEVTWEVKVRTVPASAVLEEAVRPIEVRFDVTVTEELPELLGKKISETYGVLSL